MTSLEKDVTRELTMTFVRRGKYANRKIIITLLAGDMIEFRIKGTQQRFVVPAASCFNLAEIYDAQARYRQAVEQYKKRRKNGYKRLRKPRKAMFPVGKAINEALS